MTILGENLALSRVKPPPPVSRPMLAYLHSGEMMRHALPILLQIGAILWLSLFVLAWLQQWPAVYRELERWDLVRGFFAQLVALATAGLIIRITLLRASHLTVFPADDFVVLRTTAVLCRWFAEVALVYALGMGMSSWLQPVSAVAMAFLGSVPEEGGSTGVRLASGAVSAFQVMLVTPIFLLLYAIATAIDLGLAIESNTRLERAGRP